MTLHFILAFIVMINPGQTLCTWFCLPALCKISLPHSFALSHTLTFCVCVCVCVGTVHLFMGYMILTSGRTHCTLTSYSFTSYFDGMTWHYYEVTHPYSCFTSSSSLLPLPLTSKPTHLKCQHTGNREIIH